MKLALAEIFLVVLRSIAPYLRPLERLFAHVSRGVTLGVRGVAFDPEGRVLLVQHTYLTGWHLPGGGVNRNECLSEALNREMFEEVGIVVQDAIFFSIYRNGRNHIACYIITDWRSDDRFGGSWEIRRSAWTNIKDLPEDTSRAVRNRINEIIEKVPMSKVWDG
jgi:ADP-ribose pyrophosphatase YjhB (NUDIX family)